MNRRHFLHTAAGAAVAARLSAAPSVPPSGRLRVAVMGLGRGAQHVSAWLAVPGVEVAALCETDARRMAGPAAAVEKATGKAPALLPDFRKALEDPDIDVLSIAAPNFWHAPAAILACQAGKHVYVEKPGSHTVEEGQLMVAAARKYERRVQQGTQRRSLAAQQEGIRKLGEGVIGKVHSVRCVYNARRGAVRLPEGGAPPDWLDWALWQGPCPDRPWREGLAPYSWHWRWHYGGGELANNGVHALDLALWGLSALRKDPLELRRVACSGGRYHFPDDDQETPDTMVASFDFGDCAVFFDSSSCHERKDGGKPAFVTFAGEGGMLVLTSSGYRIHDEKGAVTAEVEPAFSDVPHFQNLADAIREGTPLHCEIGEGQRSTLLCHLGNIAWRTGTAVEWDAAAGHIRGTAAAQALERKEYRPGWAPQV